MRLPEPTATIGFSRSVIFISQQLFLGPSLISCWVGQFFSHSSRGDTMLMDLIYQYWSIKWLMANLVLLWIPYFCVYSPVRDFALRVVTPNKVWLWEDNPLLMHKFVPLELEQLPREEANGQPNCYGVFGSVWEAEDWLLEKGYAKRDLYTARFGGGSDQKTFPVKRIPGTNVYSVINVVVDYGDGDWHFLTYRYAPNRSPFNFGKFENETESPDSLPNGSIAFGERSFLSTHHSGSHTFGGHHMRNSIDHDMLKLKYRNAFNDSQSR